jgi:hypothetical protein
MCAMPSKELATGGVGGGVDALLLQSLVLSPVGHPTAQLIVGHITLPSFSSDDNCDVACGKLCYLRCSVPTVHRGHRTPRKYMSLVCSVCADHQGTEHALGGRRRWLVAAVSVLGEPPKCTADCPPHHGAAL